MRHSKNVEKKKNAAEPQRSSAYGFQFALVWLLLLFFFFSIQILNGSYHLETFDKLYEFALWAALIVTAGLLHERKDECRQFLWIVGFLAAIWGMGLLNPNVRKWNHVMILTGAVSLLVSFLILLHGAVRGRNRDFHAADSKIEMWKRSSRASREKMTAEEQGTGKICRYIPVAGILLLFFLFSLETFSEVPHLDSTMYYTKFNKLSTQFDYSFQNILSEFCFYKHLSIGYALFVLLGEEIQSYTTVGVHFVNFAMAALSGISLYRLLDAIYPHGRQLWKYLGMAVYLFSPFVLGTLGYFNIDLPAVYFFVILLSCMIRERRILAFFAAYVFVFSKEPCVIYYCFFLLGLWICSWKKQPVKKMSTFFLSIPEFIRRFSYELLLVVLWLVSYLFLGSNSWGGGISVDMVAGTEKMRTFGFTMENFLVKLGQIFVLNLNWIFVLVIIACMLIRLTSGRNKESENVDGKRSIRDGMDSGKRDSYRICLWSTLLGILVFNIFFLDLINPRYIATGSVIVVLLGYDSMIELLKRCTIKTGKPAWAATTAAVFLVCLVLTQSFVSIDPVSYLVFWPVEYYGENLFISAHKGGAISERTIYNREYNYFDRILSKILDEADYQEGDLVFFAGHFPNPYGYQPLMAWDRKDRKLRTVENENTVVVDLDRVEIPDEKQPRRIITILEWNQEDGGHTCREVRFRSMRVKYYVQEAGK